MTDTSPLVSLKTTNILFDCNVGKDFHGKSLSDLDHPAAKDIAEWINGKMAHDLTVGRNLVVHGKSALAYDINVLAIRGMIIKRKLPIRYYQLNELLDHDSIAELYDSYPALCVAMYLPKEKELNLEYYRRFESLMNRYIDRGQHVSFHLPVDDFAELKETIMSPVLIDRIQTRFKIVKV